MVCGSWLEEGLILWLRISSVLQVEMPLLGMASSLDLYFLLVGKPLSRGAVRKNVGESF